MKKRLSRQEKKLYSELELTGIAIEDVYGSKKSSPLFLCLAKALIIFMVCTGTVTGFCDAFQLNYNKSAIVLFTLVMSVLIALLYAKKQVFYLGYVLFLIVFTVELLRYYLYANSGFQAITNRVREVYADYFSMSVVRNAEEQFTNRYLTITITLFFIIAFLIIMYNITVSRYMNFAETFAISFIILEIPMYVGYKPPVLSVILIMAGCICTGLLQKGSFNRVTIPGKKYPDYIKDRFFKRTYYTTRGNHKGILLILAVSLVFSIIICIISLPVFNRDLGETPEDSAKAAFDDTVKIVVQNGIQGLFNRYDSTNGLNRGRLGGVSSVSPDFKTDIAVSFVPYSRETLYLPGFKGLQYDGSSWQTRVDLLDYDDMLLLNVNDSAFTYTQDETRDSINVYLDESYINEIDKAFSGLLRGQYRMKSTTDSGEDTGENESLSTGLYNYNYPYADYSVNAKAEISYVDKSFGMRVFPYITYTGVLKQSGEPLYQSKDPEKEQVLDTMEMTYYPEPLAKYTTPELMANNAMRSVVISVLPDEDECRVYLDTYTLSRNNISGNTYISLTALSDKGDATQRLYWDYIYNICLKVPDSLEKYLKTFIKGHKYFGLNDIRDYANLQITRDALYINNGYEKEMERIISELKVIKYYLPGDPIYSETNESEPLGYVADGNAILILDNEDEVNFVYEKLYQGILEFYTKEFEDYEEINAFRLKACEAVKDMFYDEYPYTLSPGRTPQGTDYVRYFLEEQKRGLCSHFASSAVMILRQMGIPARYMEGYCIPYSLMQESADKLGIDGSDWFDAENEFNPDKNVFTVEVSDYYAHAWVEVYLEGKGFVPFEFTPPNFESVPSARDMSGIGGFFARLFDVDLDGSSETLSITGDGDTTTSAVIEDVSKLDLSLLVIPLALVTGSVAAFWILFLLIRKVIKERRYASYLKEGKYAPVILARYEEFVKKLKKKKIVTAKNPLPLELCEVLSEYKADTLDKEISQEEKNAVKEKVYEECYTSFTYAEKVLYSDYKTNEEEYNTYYKFITGFLTKKQQYNKK